MWMPVLYNLIPFDIHPAVGLLVHTVDLFLVF